MNRNELIESIVDDFLERLRSGQSVDQNSLIQRHADLMPELGERLEFARVLADAFKPERLPTDSIPRESIEKTNCPHCGNAIAFVDEWSTVKCGTCGSDITIDLNSAAEDNVTPTILNGRYFLQTELGRGSFGIVYKGYDQQLSRIVAIKIPRRGLFASKREEALFRREAEHAAQLKHPGIVQVFDVGQSETCVFIVSEFVNGITLQELLDGSQLDYKKTAQIVKEICDALHHAHEQGVIHRDVKPSNIIVDGDYRPHLTDFGLAFSNEAVITMTRDGQIIGTPAYMSPEQANAEHRRVDRRSDIYSIGATLYQMLAGELPFRGSARMLVNQVLYEDPKPISQINENVPRDLETIALKAMTKAPAERYQSSAELAADLSRWLNGDPIKARRPSLAERLYKWCKKRPVIASLTALSFALIALLIAGSIFWAVQSERRSKEDARQAKLAKLELIQSLNSSGIRSAAEQTYGDSLLWFSEALAVEESLSDKTASKLSRIRIQQLLSDQPALVKLLTDTGPIECSYKSDDQLYLVSKDKLSVLTLTDFSIKELMRISPPREIKVNANSKLIASLAIDNNSLNIYDLQTLKHVCCIRQNIISGFDFNNDGQQLLTSSADGSTKVWNTLSGELVTRHDYPGRSIAGCKFSTSGAWLVSWQIDLSDLTNEFHIQSAQAEKKFSTSFGDESVIQVLLVDDNRFVVCGSQGSIRQLEVVDDELTEKLFSDTSAIVSAVSLRAGKQLLTLNTQGISTLWDLENGQRENQVIHSGATTLTVSPDETLYAVTGDGQPIFFHWTHSAKPAIEAIPHAGQLTNFLFCDDNRRLVVADADGVLRLWDLAGTMRWKNILIHQGLRKARYSPDGKWLVTFSELNNAKIWNVQTGIQTGPDLKHQAPVMDASFSSDGKKVLTGDYRGGLQLWNTSNGKVIPTPRIEADSDSSVSRIQFSPTDPEKFVVGRHDGSVTVWNTSGPQAITRLQRSDRINSFAFDKSGRYIQASSADGVVQICDLESESFDSVILPHEGPIRSGVFSPNGRILLTSGEYATVWDWQKQSIIWRQKTAATPNAAFSPNGENFATPLDRRSVAIWDSHDQIAPIFTFAQQRLTWCDFHPTLPLFAGSGISGTRDQSKSVAQVWDLRNGMLALPVTKGYGRALQVAFGGDGQSFMACSSEGTVILRTLLPNQLSTSDLMALAQLQAGRKNGSSKQTLTGKEQAELLHSLSNKHPKIFDVTPDNIQQWENYKQFTLDQ